MLNIFVESFLVLYFLDLSASNILPFGIYKLVSVTTIFFTIFSLRNLSKSKYRVNLLKIGIGLEFIYFLTILLWREKIVDYMYFLGILYGLEEGFYFSVYNIFESDGIKNEERAKFNGMYTAVKSILAIVFPILMGTYIFTSGFLNSLMVVLAIVVIKIILSFQYKDNNVPTQPKTNFAEYSKIVKQNRIIRQFYKLKFYGGLTYSEGAFSSIVTIYIIKIFSNSLSLVICTYLFSIITIGLIFAKFMKPENYSRNIKIVTTFTVLSLFAMITNCNIYTVVIFNFCQTISKKLTELINSTNEFNLANVAEVKKEYKVEYFVGMELFLFIGRVISQSLFILIAFMENSNIMIIIFSMFLILYELNSAEFNDEIQKTKRESFKFGKLANLKIGEGEYE